MQEAARACLHHPACAALRPDCVRIRSAAATDRPTGVTGCAGDIGGTALALRRDDGPRFRTGTGAVMTEPCRAGHGLTNLAITPLRHQTYGRCPNPLNQPTSRSGAQAAPRARHPATATRAAPRCAGADARGQRLPVAYTPAAMSPATDQCPVDDRPHPLPFSSCRSRAPRRDAGRCRRGERRSLRPAPVRASRSTEAAPGAGPRRAPAPLRPTASTRTSGGTPVARSCGVAPDAAYALPGTRWCRRHAVPRAPRAG